MKVKAFTKEDKKYVTAYDVEKSREIIRDMKEDESTPAEYLETAAKSLKGVYHAEIINAAARVACNRRVWDAYSAGSQDLDIYVEGLAKVEYNDGNRYRVAYVEIGAYLSDIWQLTGSEEDDATTTSMFYLTWYNMSH
jgi:hypothetical protein